MNEVEKPRPAAPLFGQQHDASKKKGRLLSRMVNSLQEESAKCRRSSEGTSRLFLKQNRVVGREKQLILLDGVYQRISQSQSEVVLIHGPSGVGKSTLLEVFVKQLPPSVFYVTGKFDQLQSHAPYAALVSAADQLCRQASRRENSSDIRERLREVLGDEINLLGSLIPAIAKMTATTTTNKGDGTKRRGGRGSTRFKLLFRAFLRCVASPENPVIIFLDDIQWADSASLTVLKALVTDGLSRHIMIIGAYRDNEMTVDILRQCNLSNEGTGSTIDDSTVSSLSAHRARVTDIEVAGLDVDSLNELIASVLTMDESETLSLSSLVLSKTHGNAFYVLNFLEMLVSRSLLLKADSGSWTWDEHEILERTNVSDNLAAILKAKLTDLPEQVRSILQIASFIGHSFTTEVLVTIVHEEQDMIETEYSFDKHSRDVIHNRIVDTFKVALAEGLLETTAEADEYKFSHDKVQQCLYIDLIPDDVERSLLHQRIGAHIWNSVKGDEISDFDDRVFLAAENLNRALELVEYSGTRYKLIAVNVRAAKLAMAKSAFIVASGYLRIAVGLVEGDASWNSHYDMCIDLYSTAAEAEKNIASYERSKELAKEVHKRAKSFQHRHAAYYVELQSLAVQGNLNESILLGLSVLRKIGVKFRKKITTGTVMKELIIAKIAIGTRPLEDLIKLPEMTDPDRLFALNLMSDVAINSFVHGGQHKETYIAVSLRMVRMTVRYGLSPMYSPAAFATWGAVHAILGNIDVSLRSEKLSLAIIDKFHAEPVRGRAMIFNYSLNHLWRNALDHNVLHEFLRAYHLSMSFGDMIFGSYGFIAWIFAAIYLDVPIGEIHNRTRSVVVEGRECESSTLLMFVLPSWQILLNLSGDPENPDPRFLMGEAFDEDYTMDIEALNSITANFVWRKCEEIVAYTYEDWDRLDDLLKLNRKFEKEGEGYFLAGFNLGWDALSHYELYLINGKRKHKREGQRIHKCIKKWVTNGTVIFAGLNKLLIATESMCVKKSPKQQVKKLFQDAFVALATNKNRFYEALANERLARLFLTEDPQATKGHKYLSRAVNLYTRWGALAKVDWLKKRYAQASICV